MAQEIDGSICPKCNSDEDTCTYDDWIWELGYTNRHCEKCDIMYKVHYKIVATKIEYKQEDENK